jgi:hypothetical protein
MLTLTRDEYRWALSLVSLGLATGEQIIFFGIGSASRMPPRKAKKM